MLTRRALLKGGVTATLVACARRPRPVVLPASMLGADFDQCWETTRDRYCFFEEKATDWDAVRAHYRPRAVSAANVGAFAEVVDAALRELYDPHARVLSQEDGAARPAPWDLWAEWREGRAIITARRTFSAAEHLVPGIEIVSLDRTPIATAARAMHPRCLRREDPAVAAWALVQLIGGRFGFDRTLGLRLRRGDLVDVVLPDRSARHPYAYPSLPREARRIGASGYIPFANFLEPSVVERFDESLLMLRDAPGLVLDLRDNCCGDPRHVRSIMGRFVTERRRHAWFARRDEGQPGLAPRTEGFVEPRGPFTYDRPVVVLVNRFCASMAEELPVGMRAVAGARLVGTVMAGLDSTARAFVLDHSHLRIGLSVEATFDADGRRRSDARPDVAVVLEEQSQPPGSDPLLIAGLIELQAMVARRNSG